MASFPLLCANFFELECYTLYNPCNMQPPPPPPSLLPPPPPPHPSSPPPLSAGISAIPFVCVVAGILVSIVPVAHIIKHIMTHVAACRRPPSTPTVGGKVAVAAARQRDGGSLVAALAVAMGAAGGGGSSSFVAA
jgi:hypothetical protein